MVFELAKADSEMVMTGMILVKSLWLMNYAGKIQKKTFYCTKKILAGHVSGQVVFQLFMLYTRKSGNRPVRCLLFPLFLTLIKPIF